MRQDLVDVQRRPLPARAYDILDQNSRTCSSGQRRDNVVGTLAACPCLPIRRIHYLQDGGKHIAYVRSVCSLPQKARVQLNPEQFVFFSGTVDYLGHLIRAGKQEVSEHSREAITGLQMLHNIPQLLSFLGLCNVFRRIVWNFSGVFAPFNRKLCKDQPFDFGGINEDELEVLDGLQKLFKTPRSYPCPVPKVSSGRRPTPAGSKWVVSSCRNSQMVPPSLCDTSTYHATMQNEDMTRRTENFCPWSRPSACCAHTCRRQVPQLRPIMTHFVGL